MAIYSNRSAKVSIAKTLESTRHCRVSLTTFRSVRHARVAIASQANYFATQARTKIYKAYDYVTFYENISTYAAALISSGQAVDTSGNFGPEDTGYLAPFVQYQLVLNIMASTIDDTSAQTIDLTPYLETWKFKWPFKGRATATMTLVHHSTNPNTSTNVMDSTTDPYSYIADVPSLFAFLQDHRFRSNDLTLTRYLRMTYTINNVSYPGPKLIPGSPHFDGNTLTWSAEDMTMFLEQPKQDMPDYDVNGGFPGTAKQAFIDIMNAKGFGPIGTLIPRSSPPAYLTVNNPFYMGFTDYPLSLFRRRGIPLAWIGELTSRQQCGQFFSGDTWMFMPPAWYNSPSATYTEYQSIETTDIVEDLSGLKNHIAVNRTQTGGGNIGSDICNGTPCPGIRTLNFDVPSKSVNILFSTNCQINTFVYKDATGTPTSPDPQGTVYYGNIPVTSCTFICTPPFAGVTAGIADGNITANIPPSPYYEIDAFGGGVYINTNGTSSHTFDALKSQGAHGFRPEESAIDTGLYLVDADCIAFGINKVLSYVNRVYRSTLGTPFFNPGLLPGSTIAVTDLRTKQNNLLWFVEEIEHSLEKDGDFYMSLDLRRGLLPYQEVISVDNPNPVPAPESSGWE